MMIMMKMIMMMKMVAMTKMMIQIKKDDFDENVYEHDYDVGNDDLDENDDDDADRWSPVAAH